MYIIVFIYGIFIGSFLNVCIYRIPDEASVVHGRSHCMNCNTSIQWYDLIPVFSYILLGGKCRNCKSKISIQYPIIEALNGFLYLHVFYLYGWTWISVVYCLIISALIVLSIIDYRTNTINLGINVFIFIMGLFMVGLKYYSTRDLNLILNHIIGFFVVSGFLLLILLITGGRGMGFGDVNLMAASGLVLGWKYVLLAFFIGCILASILHPIQMKLKRYSRVLAFGPYLAIGITIALLFGQQIIELYMKTYT
jgi:leader peptidase (prepilin peptidase)/N-methyltransferase